MDRVHESLPLPLLFHILGDENSCVNGRKSRFTLSASLPMERKPVLEYRRIPAEVDAVEQMRHRIHRDIYRA